MDGCNRLVAALSLALCALGYDMEANYQIGFFNDNDIVVAKDAVYKQSHPFNRVKAEYGRVFPCIISSYAVADKTKEKTGVPTVTTVRGGLGHNFVNLVLSAPVGKPISVTVFVSCHNIRKKETIEKKEIALLGKVESKGEWEYYSYTDNSQEDT